MLYLFTFTWILHQSWPLTVEAFLLLCTGTLGIRIHYCLIKLVHQVPKDILPNGVEVY